MQKVLGVHKPIIAAVPLRAAANMKDTVADTLRDIARLDRAKVDALVFENWGFQGNDKPAGIRLQEYMGEIIKAASKITGIPYGIHVYPIDYKAAFDVAGDTKARFVKLNTFVDTIVEDRSYGPILKVEPYEVIGYRKKSDLCKVALFTGIQISEYMTITVPHKSIAQSASEAIVKGSDGLIVTLNPKYMSAKEMIHRAETIRGVSEKIPVLAGNGITERTIEKILPHVDGVIIGAKHFRFGRSIENPVDSDRASEFVEKIRRMRRAKPERRSSMVAI